MSGVGEGFALPPGWPAAEDEYRIDPARAGAPVPLERPVLDPARSGLLLEHLMNAGSRLVGRPVMGIARSLGTVGARFSDSGDDVHRLAVDRVAEEASLSTEGSREVVSRMATDWTFARLERVLLSDFPNPGALDGFVPGGNGERVRAVGGRLALHICSGNVPGVGTTSLVRSLLVKCPVLLKPGRTDTALPVLFARALADEDEPLAEAAAVMYWPRDGGGPLEDAAFRTAERVVAYGGDEAVESLRARTPVTTPFLAYHHRLSLAVVGRSAIESAERARAAAERAAAAISAYDARGCVSPRLIFVEEGASTTPSKWAETLATALERSEARTPAGRVPDDDAAVLRQLADAVEVRRAAGDEVFARNAADFSWVVIYGPPDLAPPVSGGRAVVVSPIDDMSVLSDLLGPLARSLQSVAVEAEGHRAVALADALARIGVTRVTSLDRLPWPPAWWRHDGLGPLSALVRWSTIDVGGP